MYFDAEESGKTCHYDFGWLFPDDEVEPQISRCVAMDHGPEDNALQTSVRSGWGDGGRSEAFPRWKGLRVPNPGSPAQQPLTPGAGGGVKCPPGVGAAQAWETGSRRSACWVTVPSDEGGPLGRHRASFPKATCLDFRADC